MTTVLLLTAVPVILARSVVNLAQLILSLIDRIRVHFAPRGITSLDRGELITRPMLFIARRGLLTPVDDAMIAP